LQANAQARKNMEVAAAGRRQQLLAASAAGIAPKKASETDAVASSQKITHSLQRTRQLMAQVSLLRVCLCVCAPVPNRLPISMAASVNAKCAMDSIMEVGIKRSIHMVPCLYT
jgi:flagellar biosynthesis component FlhA